MVSTNTRSLGRALVAPMARHLEGVTHLIVVPDGVLIGLPFVTLLMDAGSEEYRHLASLYERERSLGPDDVKQYTRLAWLGRQYAITIVPSATALGTLRRRGERTAAPGEPFIGIGDPRLAGHARTRGGAMVTTRGAAGAAEQLRELRGLPEAREELTTLARTSVHGVTHCSSPHNVIDWSLMEGAAQWLTM